MQRWTRWTLAVVCAAALATASQARALVIAPPPGPARVAQADVVVVGRVVAHEDKDIEVMLPGGAKQTYRIAVINITEHVRGMKDAKTVRVGFLPVKGPVGVPPAVRPPIGIRPGFGPVNLDIGQDGLFFLTKHGKETFYTAANYYDAVPRTAPDFEKQLGDAKKTAKLLEDPMAGLKSDNQEDRFNTASLLITKYRQVRSFSGKTEAIPAEESKLILKALMEANWDAPRTVTTMDAFTLFNQIGLTPKDGWTPKGRDIKEFHQAA